MCSGIYCNDCLVAAELGADVPQKSIHNRVHHPGAERSAALAA
jgi:hypothetical protein